MRFAAGVAVALTLLAACSVRVSPSFSDRPQDATVNVIADEGVCWTGNIGSATQQGCGNQSFDVHDPRGLFVSSIQKKAADGNRVVVSIDVSGKNVASNSTTADYGVAMVSAP